MLKILTNTLPTLLLDANPKRSRLVIQMQAQSVDANNTGRVHVGLGYQAVATVGHASQGLILVQASAIDEPSTSLKLAPSYKGQIWGTASANNQSLIILQETEEEVEEKK